jgi:hypothetical protein
MADKKRLRDRVWDAPRKIYTYPKKEKERRERKTEFDLVKEAFIKVKAEGGSPSETTTKKTLSKIKKILGGGAELRGGGRAVMKKGGKV